MLSSFKGGFEGSGFLESDSQHCTINVPTHSADWEAWNGSGSDLQGRVLEGEMPYQTAGMQTVQRVKRQNCGNNVPGHHNLILGNRDQIGSRFAVTNVEAEGIMSHSPRTMLEGSHGSADQGDRKLSAGNFQSGPSDIVSSSSSFSGLPSYAGNVLRSPASERGSPHYRASGPMGNFMNISYPPQSCTGSRTPCKRKSSMDDVIMSVGSLSFRPFIEQRESELSRFTEAAGTSRADSAFPSTSSHFNLTSRIPSLDDLPNSRDSHMLCQQPLRPRPSHHAQIGSNRFYEGHGPQELCHAPYAQVNRVASDISPSNMWMSRGIMSHEHSMQSTWSTHEFSPFDQSHPSSAVVPWCGNGSVAGERINHPSSYREYSAGLNMGSHARNFSNGASIWMGVPPWTQNVLEPSGTGFPFRQFSSQGSPMAPVRHMHLSSVPLSPPLPPPYTGHASPYSRGYLLPFSPPSHTSVILGSQAAPGHAYPPSLELLNRSAMRSPLLGSAESGGTSPLPNFYGMPFQAERRGGPPRLPSHGMFDHAFTYSGFDIYDQHLGLQPDVDNMSYEELLALGERIGNVNTGLSVENVSKCLKTSKHSSYDVTRSAASQESEIKCSICQEEYMEGDEVGQLDCSHGYHTACIKQWLMLKNQCPICKAAALSLP